MKDYNQRHFLLIDDAESILAMFQMCFKEIGIDNYKTFLSGEEAWSYFKDYPNKDEIFFISDLNMPDFSGRDLLLKVREEKNKLEVPFLVVSAENDRERIMDVMEEGANFYVLKPFTARSLRRKLDHFF